MKCEEANENNDILKNLILVNLRWIYSNEGKITKENNFSTFFFGIKLFVITKKYENNMLRKKSIMVV